MNLFIAVWMPLLVATAAAPPKPSYTLDQYMAIKRANDPSFSPDAASVAFASNASGEWQIWTTPTSRWAPKQVSRMAGGVIGRWSPNAAVILAMSDRGGDQKHQLYTIDVASGETTLVTHAPDARHALGGWMPDGRSIFYTSNARDRRYFDCYVEDVATQRAERVYESTGLLHAQAVSHDGGLLAVEDLHSAVDNDILIIDTRAKTARRITPHTGSARFAVVGFSSDDHALYCRSDLRGEYMALRRIDIASAAGRELFVAQHDVDYAVVNVQGTQLAFSENVDGFERPALWDVASGRRLPLPDLPEGINTPQEFSADGSKLSIVVSTPAHDDEVWIVDLKARHADRVTFSPQGGVAENSYVSPQLIHYPSFDGRMIPALLFVPPGASSKQRVPVVLSIHGGPEEQEQPYLTNYYQFLCARGYAVLAPNVRGSTGYGKSYVELDNGPLRWDALKDVAAAVDWIRGRQDLDADKVACLGASYGGFITLAMLAHYPDLFRAGVDFYGPADLRTFLGRTSEYRRLQRIAEYGDPVGDSTFMAAISPALHADRIKRPLLVVQGANDPIVPPAESEDITRLVKAHGGIAEYLLFPDEGHGLAKQADYVKAYDAVLGFLNRYMPPPPGFRASAP
jgi:dipeptidyl aminopeptidase/acylaminoacyl peptidase